MNTKIYVSSSTMGSGFTYTCFFTTLNKTPILIIRDFNECNIEYVSKTDKLPNYIECDYMENYESFIFQESLVWDKEIDFFMYLALQKYYRDNKDQIVRSCIYSINLEY